MLQFFDTRIHKREFSIQNHNTSCHDYDNRKCLKKISINFKHVPKFFWHGTVGGTWEPYFCLIRSGRLFHFFGNLPPLEGCARCLEPWAAQQGCAPAIILLKKSQEAKKQMLSKKNFTSKSNILSLMLMEDGQFSGGSGTFFQMRFRLIQQKVS